MKYSVGQKVKIRSLAWYQDNVNRYGIIECGKYEFFEPMNEYCGKVVTIKRIDDDNYRIDTDKGAFCWTDEMIEGLVEEETLIERVDDNGLPFNEWLSHKGAFHIPDGYELKDENGNVINATKIVLEKKIGLTKERINAIVHESCILFCKHCGCGIPRETCTSLGTCNDHDKYRSAIRAYLMNKYKD